jgi:predicted TIM-barrel fold metal-dependent hydrolase
MNRSTPQRAGCFCGIVAAQETFTVTSDQARHRAEKSFKQEERARDGRKAMAEYEVQARAIREKTARLKALRLAKEAQAQNEEPPAKA